MIENRRANPLDEDDEGEVHHIIPISEGGSDDATNLIKLTVREHYVAHLLLAKIYDDMSMYRAVTYMQCKSKTHKRNFRFNSHLYQQFRQLSKEKFSKHMQKYWKDKEWRARQSKIVKDAWKNDEYRKKLSEAVKLALANPTVRAKMHKKHVCSDKLRKHNGDIWRGRKRSEQNKLNL